MARRKKITKPRRFGRTYGQLRRTPAQIVAAIASDRHLPKLTEKSTVADLMDWLRWNNHGSINWDDEVAAAKRRRAEYIADDDWTARHEALFREETALPDIDDLWDEIADAVEDFQPDPWGKKRNMAKKTSTKRNWFAGAVPKKSPAAKKSPAKKSPGRTASPEENRDSRVKRIASQLSRDELDAIYRQYSPTARERTKLARMHLVTLDRWGQIDNTTELGSEVLSSARRSRRWDFPKRATSVASSAKKATAKRKPAAPAKRSSRSPGRSVPVEDQIGKFRVIAYEGGAFNSYPTDDYTLSRQEAFSLARKMSRDSYIRTFVYELTPHRGRRQRAAFGPDFYDAGYGIVEGHARSQARQQEQVRREASSTRAAAAPAKRRNLSRFTSSRSKAWED